LGRDEEGAKTVNLYPSDRPQDVYSKVLDLVEKSRESEENTNEIAKILKGHVQRKVKTIRLY
jgi:DNA-directed RNA polymerase